MSQQQKGLAVLDKRKKRTYAELLEMYKGLLTKTADAYIPELFEALHKERADWKNDELESKIVKDLEGINKPSTIHGYRPDWMKNPNRIRGGQKAATTLTQKNYVRQQTREKLEQIDEQTPEPEQDENSQTTTKGQPLDQWEDEHPEIAPSPFELIGEINKSIDRLWRALTGIRYMPTKEDNVQIDHIKPTRQFRNDIAKGSSETERTYLYNWLVWLRMAEDDMFNILEKEK